MIVIMIIMIVVFNDFPGCRLLSHCDNRIHWPCLLFFSPVDGRIQVQLQITKVQMQMKMNTGSNKNKSGSSRQWNKYFFYKSINAIDDFILPLPPAKPVMRTVVQFIQKEGRVWGELLSFIFCVYPDILVFNFCATQIFHGRAPPLGRLGCRQRARKSFQWWRRRLPGVYPYLISHRFICNHLQNLSHHHLYHHTGVSWVWLGRGKWERLARGLFTHNYLLFLILLHVN